MVVVVLVVVEVVVSGCGGSCSGGCDGGCSGDGCSRFGCGCVEYFSNTSVLGAISD